MSKTQHIGYKEYNGCPVKCAKCEQNTYAFTVLWSNGHGTKIRVFCSTCKWGTDYKNLYANDKPAQVTYQCEMGWLK